MRINHFHLCGFTWISFLWVCCVLGNSAFAVEQVSKEAEEAAKIIDLYAKHQDEISKVYLEFEVTTQVAGKYYRDDFKHLNDVPIIKQYAGTFAYDGSRCSLRQQLWGNQNPMQDPVPKENAHYESVLWTQKNFHQYSHSQKTLGLAWVAREQEEIEKAKPVTLGKYMGKFLLGYPSAGVSADRIDVILRKASKITLRKDQDRIGGSSCFVVDAELNIGSFTVWFDPQRQYCMAQLKVEAKEGNIDGNTVLPRDYFRTAQWTILEYESINGLFVPKKCEFRGDSKFPNGDYRHFSSTFTAKRITLNPDFDKMDLFNEQDIKDGADVRLLGHPGLEFCWENKDGVTEVKPKMDEPSVKKIVSEVAAIKKNVNWRKNDPSPTSSTQTVATPIPPKIIASPTPSERVKQTVQQAPTDKKNWIYATVFGVIAVCLAIYIKKM
jgi:hypothetical protein